MSRLNFYRKYRSQSFDEVVGQSHIIQTLKNAIEHSRLNHAYIFSGPRGTGKTSTARIFAKTLNCTEGMTLQDCPIAAHITSGTCVDVIEMDAASHTGVDNIRVLNEQVKFSPVEALYKFFIIDEAHMLSSGAFNALLKTMEEPPENTIFILATTEPQKIPVTIHSRCQHLQFKKLSTQDIVGQLSHIAQAEGITIPEKGLLTIARQAQGCMRDAISLFDQVYSFKGTEIGQEDVLLILGAANFEHLVGLMTVYFQKDVTGTMTQLQDIFDEGVNIHKLTQDIISFLRMTLFVKLGVEGALDIDEARVATLKTLSQNIAPGDLKTLLENFAKVEMDMRWFPNPALLLQLKFLHFLEGPAPAEASAKEGQIKISTPKITETVPEPEPEPVMQQAQPTPPTVTPVIKEDIADEVKQPIQTNTPEKNHPPREAPAEASAKEGPHNTQPLFDRLIESIRSDQPGLFFILSGAKVLNQSDSRLTIKLAQDFQFSREKLAENRHVAILRQAVQTHFNKPLGLSLENQVIFEGQQSSPAANSAVEGATPAATPAPADDPMVEERKLNDIVSMFEGSVLPS